MPGIDTTVLGDVGRALPAALADPTKATAQKRKGRYGEDYVLSPINSKHILADEGGYFVVTNPTIGTPVAYALTTAFSDTTTSVVAVIKNNDSAGGKRIYLDTLKLMMGSTAPTATTVMNFAVKLDTINRAPTANFVQVTPANTNSDSGTSSISQVWMFNAGAATVPASSSSARVVARAQIPTSLGITGDVYALQFGALDVSAVIPGLTAVRATAPGKFVENCAPVVIGPQSYAVCYMWWLSMATNAPSFEYELGFYER